MRIGRAIMAATAAVLATAGGAGAQALTVRSAPKDAGAQALTARAAPKLASVRGTQAASVWVGAVGAKSHRLGAGSAPLISPDGRFVAASGFGQANENWLSLLPSAAGRGHTFLRSPAAYTLPLAWSRDSRYLAAAVSGSGRVRSRLVVIDTTTMLIRTIAKGVVEGASFAPTGAAGRADELVFGLAGSQRLGARVNLYRASPTGGSRHRITSNGRSLNPVWGAKGIVFDRERIRGRNSAPAYQLWLLNGAHRRQLTHLRIGQLVSGLEPVAVSAGGNRLLCAYVGEDTYYAWRLQLKPLRVSAVRVHRRLVQPGSISRDGRRLLIDQGAFEQAPSHGTVGWVPFGGGPLHRLGRGASPSWNE